MKIISYGNSDTGKVRSRNEDNFLVSDEYSLYAVADGLGGLPEGALASGMAKDLLEEACEKARGKNLDFEKIYNDINGAIYLKGKSIDEDIGIGTTLTCVQVQEKGILVAHVGDCCVYLFRGGEHFQLTTDHTMEEEIRSRLKPGEDTYIPEYFSHTLTRCIGQQGELEVDIEFFKVGANDRLLICSDGITKTLNPAEIMELVDAADTPKPLVNSLIDAANDKGGPDNSTAIALFLEE